MHHTDKNEISVSVHEYKVCFGFILRLLVLGTERERKHRGRERVERKQKEREDVEEQQTQMTAVHYFHRPLV